MTELLATIILSICATPSGLDVDDKCVDEINNCAVELKTSITSDSIQKCLKEYEGDE